MKGGLGTCGTFKVFNLTYHAHTTFIEIYGQTVILHTLPMNYVIIILSQNLSILHAPVEKFWKFLNELTQ